MPQMLYVMKRLRPGWRRVSVGLIALVCVPFMFRWFEQSQVLQPYRTMDDTGAVLGRPWEEVSLAAPDGVQLNAWFFPASTNATRRDYVILFCHGNAGNISHRVDCYQVLLDSGLNVFAFDYRGYGKSSGKPSEAGTYLDAQAAYDWLVRRGFPGERILVWGESLGGAVAAELASRVRVGGLILQSTFTSVPAIGAELFPFLPTKWICSIQYDTLAKLPRLQIPVLVMHGRKDSIVRFQHAERLFAAANPPKLFHELPGDHNDSWLTQEREYRKALEEFLAMVDRSPAASR